MDTVQYSIFRSSKMSIGIESNSSANQRALRLLTVILVTTTLVLCGLISGFFYAYSSSVMFGLDASDPQHAIAAMQGINREVRNWVFFPAFFLTPVVGLAAGLLLFRQNQNRAGICLMAAALLYMVGGIAPTMLVNIPMNEALATGQIPEDAASYWKDYSAPWTRWNTLRTIFSTISLVMVGAGLFLYGRDMPKR
jgi:uncharacterized membrane protein